MIIVAGSSGYIGAYILEHINKYNIDHILFNREMLDSLAYSENGIGHKVLDEARDSGKRCIFINATGYTGKPNVDACQKDQDSKNKCFYANITLPNILSQQCYRRNIAYGHISSGCIYEGDNGGRGYSEADKPNFTDSYYSWTKAEAEQCLMQSMQQLYIWRIRIPFNERNNIRNYISKLIKYDKLINLPNSLSYIQEAVAAMIECCTERLPFGIYNLTNPGAVKASDVIEICRSRGMLLREPTYIDNIELNKLVIAPRSNCVLNCTKAIDAGLKLTDCLTNIERCIDNWIP